MRVTDIVFSFPARVPFPKSNFIAEVIRARCDENTVKRIREFEKLDYCLHKRWLDLKFFM